MSAAIRQRRDLRILTGAASYAAHQRYTDESLRWEMQRAARTELLPAQPEPALFCAAERDADVPPVLLGLISAMRAEFGASWPLWLALYLAYCAAGVWGAVICIKAVLA